MKARTGIAAASAVLLVSAGGGLALALPAAASGAAASHTLKFTAEQVNDLTFSRTTEGIQDKDVNGRGRLIGFDQLNVTFNPRTGKGLALVTVDVKGGILIGYINLSSSPAFKGFVTAGVGAFKGAFGTISGRALNKAGTKHAVTITYSG
jgi:hypothetical protein